MLFAAYIGDEAGHAAWKNALQRHADWLGLDVRLDTRRLGDERAFAFAFLCLAPASRRDGVPPSARHGPDAISASDHPYALLDIHTGVKRGDEVATEADLRRWLTDETPPAAIRIGVSLHTGELAAAVPVTSVEPLYIARCCGGWALSTDLRFPPRVAEAELDERGVYALLQFGMIPPPLSIYKGVRRVPNGHLLKISPAHAEPVFEMFFHLDESFQMKGQIADPETTVTTTLDGVLSRMPGPVIVYFSGGVDSSLLAARLAALERDDFTLVNASFGPEDSSARIALEVAARLGVQCEQVAWQPSGIPAVLNRLGRDYVYPFGDPASIPGNLLVHRSLALSPSAQSAVTGIGAGPVFGQGAWIYRQQMRAARLPRPVVWAAGTAYKSLDLWRHPSMLERSASTLRRLGGASLTQTTLAQNALDGIAYQTPQHIRDEIQKVVRTYTEALMDGPRDFWDERSILHAVKYSAHDFSAIAHAPLAACGIRAVNPYIEPRMLRLGASLTEDDLCPDGVPKGLLKRMLARSVPPELVYAPARAFIPPFVEIFNHPAMRELLHETVLSKDNPLVEYVHTERTQEIVWRIQQDRPISSGARKFVWTFIFASGWLRQVGTGV